MVFSPNKNPLNNYALLTAEQRDYMLAMMDAYEAGFGRQADCVRAEDEDLESLAFDNVGDRIFDEGLDFYAQCIGNLPLLTPQEEARLIAELGSGEDRQVARAVKQLTKANLALVIDETKKYACEDVPLLDLLEEGNCALQAAIRKYNPGDGDFAGYLRKKIQLAIKGCFNRIGKSFTLACFAGLMMFTLADSPAAQASTAPSVEWNRPAYVSVADWDKIQDGVNKASAKYKVPKATLLQRIKTESNFNITAIDASGAIGLMGIDVQTAKRDCNLSAHDLLDVSKNIDCGASYLNKVGSTLKKLSDTVNANQGGKDIYQAVEDKVQGALAELLPPGTKWDVKTPGFLRQNKQSVKNIEVTFPGGVGGSGRLVAQVAVETESERNVFAVPVQVLGYGGGDFAISMAH